MENHHVDEVTVRPVSLIVGVDRLQHLADGQVVFAILVVQDVPTFEGSLRQVVDQLFLLQGELVEVLHLVTQNLQVGKLLHGVLKIVSRHSLLICRATSCQ